MIQSILDNDLYKFSMQQAVHTRYPRAEVEYVFINRDREGTPFPEGFAEAFRAEIEKMARLKLSREEKKYLAEVCYFLTPVYLDYLESYRFDPDEVRISQEGGELSILIKGPWYRTILWEVPILAIISELYYVMTHAEPVSKPQQHSINIRKARTLAENQIKYAEFGTRRRFSSEAHRALIRDLLDEPDTTLVGTSNVFLARQFGIKPIGTLAHEWFMFHAVLYGYQMANPAAIDAWVSVYQGDLGIALTDTFTTDVFLSTFDTMSAKLFDGVRHDSGDPMEFVDKIIRHYEKLHIDPITKTIVFSDSLDIDKAVAIHKYCRNRIRDSYGIGTNLTNDVGVTPLNIVIKLSRCRKSAGKHWHHTVKLSDDPGKHTGQKGEIDYCKTLLSRD